MWHQEYEQSIHVQQPRSLGFGEGQDFSLKAKAKAWGANCQGQDLVIQG